MDRTLKRGISTWLALLSLSFALVGNTSHLVWAFQVEAAEAPTSNLALTLKAIRSAKQHLQINIYEMTSPQIADAIIAQVRAGVRVEILAEGQPVGGLSTVARGVQSQIAQAMIASRPDDHFYVMTSRASATPGSSRPSNPRRFRFNHGKYALIDGRSLLIGSENYSPTGHPLAGNKGNRGWEVLIHDEAITRDYQKIFEADADPDAPDIIDLTRENELTDSSLQIEFASNQPLLMPSDTITAPPATYEASAAERVTSPDSSLSGLVKMLDSARVSIDIQQMTFVSDWGQSNSVSPLFKAVVRAARRGVTVRVLLNDERVFGNPGRPQKQKNPKTVSELNQIAAEDGLPLTARVANLKKMGVTYIHNKGALIDGQKTLISSINWNQNSVVNNREAAVLITSPSVHAHYRALFDRDWNLSAVTSQADDEDGEAVIKSTDQTFEAEDLVCSAA